MVRNMVNNVSLGGAIHSTTTTAMKTLSPSSSSSSIEKEEGEWEKRPGGMFVQKRSDGVTASPKCIRVRVAYGAVRYEISVSSQATFGELKKLLTAQCGLQYWEQRISYKGKEKQDKQYLDICGVKDKSKLLLTEDPCSRDKRLLEMQKNDKLQRAHRAITSLTSEVDSLAEQGKRVQKCVETLDMLKISNAGLKPVVVATKWETFDPSPTSTTQYWNLLD